ncbi:MAG TPA: carboxypeptidase-like regulatory domain-containing protein [bacterium]
MKAGRVLLRIAKVLFLVYAAIYIVRFQTTKPIEGVLVDAKTGKPVSKAMVHVNFAFTHPNLLLVDTTSGGFGYGTFTDEEGRFRIPRKNVTAVLGTFDFQGLMVTHPLYEFLDHHVYVPSDRKKPYRLGTVEHGVLKLKLPIMSLEDKYSRPEDVNEFAYAVDNCGPDFYKTMRDRYSIRYNIDEIMAELERLSKRYPSDGHDGSFASRAFKTHEFLMSEFRKTY